MVRQLLSRVDLVGFDGSAKVRLLEAIPIVDRRGCSMVTDNVPVFFKIFRFSAQPENHVL